MEALAEKRVFCVSCGVVTKFCWEAKIQWGLFWSQMGHARWRSEGHASHICKWEAKNHTSRKPWPLNQCPPRIRHFALVRIFEAQYCVHIQRWRSLYWNIWLRLATIVDCLLSHIPVVVAVVIDVQSPVLLKLCISCAISRSMQVRYCHSIRVRIWICDLV